MTDQVIVYTEELLKGFRDVGVRSGDVLFFHSSLKSFGFVENGADPVIDAALATVGAEGTVAVPTFVQKVDRQKASYSARERVWDIQASPSDVGVITEVFRNRTEAVRSDHCCDSLAAIGAEATTAMSGHRDAKGRPSPWNEKAFGRGSPWDWFVDRNAAYLLMGVGFEACSLFHYCQALWVESRYDVESDELMWPEFDFPAMGERLESAGLVRRTSLGRSKWACFRVAPAVELVQRILEIEPSLIVPTPLRPYGE
jgi:aminoglycoside N3'-acetyltransferase